MVLEYIIYPISYELDKYSAMLHHTLVVILHKMFRIVNFTVMAMSQRESYFIDKSNGIHYKKIKCMMTVDTQL